MHQLPFELELLVIGYLGPFDVLNLQLVSVDLF
jgi:hypothetical protein